MVVISKGNNYAVIIIRFDVEPDRDQALVNAAIDNTERIMKMKPGFISASFHKSLDGTSILNYAQWKNREIYYENMNNITSGESNILQKNKTTIDKQAINTDFNIYVIEFTGGKHDITISKDNNLVTFINFFSVKPENQQELVDLWREFVTDVVDRQPGFISANLHKSFDGTRVVNYAQWKTKEDQERMIERAEVKHWRDDFVRLADATPNFYEVFYTN